MRHGNNSGWVSGSAPVLQCPAKHNCFSPAGQLWGLRGRKNQNKWTRERWTTLCPSMTLFHITMNGVAKAPPSGQIRRLEFRVQHLPKSPTLPCYHPQWWSSPWNQHLDDKKPLFQSRSQKLLNWWYWQHWSVKTYVTNTWEKAQRQLSNTLHMKIMLSTFFSTN